MSTLELKQQIIQSVQDAKDISDMQSVQKLMDELMVTLSRDTLKPLTVEEYEARIQAGLDSVQSGKFYTEEEAKKKLDSIMKR